MLIRSGQTLCVIPSRARDLCSWPHRSLASLGMTPLVDQARLPFVVLVIVDVAVADDLAGQGIVFRHDPAVGERGPPVVALVEGDPATVLGDVGLAGREFPGGRRRRRLLGCR